MVEQILELFFVVRLGAVQAMALRTFPAYTV